MAITPYSGTVPNRLSAGDNEAYATQVYEWFLYLDGTWVSTVNSTEVNINNKEASVVAKEAIVVANAATATTKAQLASDYAQKVNATVETGTYSSKEHAIGDLTATGGSAKAWAIDASSPDGTTTKSSKTWALEAADSATAAAAAVASIPAGSINDTITTLVDTWSSVKINTELGNKQATLVSGTNIKTVNGVSILGSGNLGITDDTKLPLTGGTMTGAINTARATVASHATTAQIWTALGNQIDWTGTATTTIFPNAPQAGAERTLICAGACSFTAGANMLIDGVASGATVTCAVGDTVIVRAISTTQFKLTRLKADGTSQVSATGGSMVFLSEIIASGAATVDIETTFNSMYDTYIIEVVNLTTTSAASNLEAYFKISGAYLTTNYSSSYHTNRSIAYTLTELVAFGNIIDGLSTVAGMSCSFTSKVYLPSSTSMMKLMTTYGIMRSNYNSASNPTINIDSAVSNTATGALTGIRFKTSTGNISGTFRLYGIKKS